MTLGAGFRRTGTGAWLAARLDLDSRCCTAVALVVRASDLRTEEGIKGRLEASEEEEEETADRSLDAVRDEAGGFV